MNANVEKFFNSIGLAIIAIVFLLFLIVTVVYRKKKSSVGVSRVFRILIIVSAILCVNEITYTYSLVFNPSDSLLTFISLKLNVLLIVVSFELFLALAIDRINIKLSKLQKTLFIIAMCILAIIPLFFGVEHNVNDIQASYAGPAIAATIIVCFIPGLIMLYLFTSRRKEIANIKLLPLYTVFLSYGFLKILEASFKTLLNDMPPFIVLVVVTMYLSFENQDLELINEYSDLKNEAEKANESKRQFLSGMSHEIRTPLSIILGYCNDGLETEDIDEEYIKSSTKDILDSSKELMELMSNMVDISKIDNDKLYVHNAEYKLKDIIYEINSVISAKIGNTKINLKYEIDENLPSTYKGDSYLLFKIINNLLLNAVSNTKYGDIKLVINGIYESNNICDLSINIIFRGQTLDKEIFEKEMNDLFNNDGNNLYANNSMLNLIVAKNLVNKLNGNIVYTNDNNSNYNIKLKQEYVGDEKFGKLFELSDDFIDEFNNEKLSDYSDKKVLICSLNDYSMKLIMSYLKKYNIQLFITEKGLDLPKLIKENTYDAIFIDESIKDISYDEAMNEMIKTGYKVPNTVLILNNPYADLNDVEYGNNDFKASIVKNTSLRKIDKVLKHVLEGVNNNDL